MGDQVYSLLPIILVSAKDNAAASYIISEVIDNDVTDIYRAEDGDLVQDRVWRIVNKYYTADVRLHASGDEQLPGTDESFDAHIIYLQEDECAVSWCERRAARGGHVRLVLSACGGALAAWCAARRYELVSLAAGAPGDSPDDWGVRRARLALHAHAWRGLARTAPPRTAPTRTALPLDAPESESSSDAEGSVESAELFAAALAALPGAAGHARARADADPRELRLARAEALLQEFCRALGLRLDDC